MVEKLGRYHLNQVLKVSIISNKTHVYHTPQYDTLRRVITSVVFFPIMPTFNLSIISEREKISNQTERHSTE